VIRLAVGQFEPRVGDSSGNMQKLESLLQSAHVGSVDVLVLPELANSGYVFSSRDETIGLSEEVPAGTFSKLLQASSKEGRLVVSGICEREGDKLYNSAAAFGNGKHVATYRKVHLFNREGEWFLTGDKEPPVFEYKGFKFGLMICFDWAFPEMARVLALKGAEVILHPANLVLPYCQNAMITRSVENRVFTATANRIGTERGTTFSGVSQVTSPRGEVLVRGGANDEGLFWVDINPNDADDKMITEYNHVLNDRHPMVYRRLTRVS